MAADGEQSLGAAVMVEEKGLGFEGEKRAGRARIRRGEEKSEEAARHARIASTWNEDRRRRRATRAAARRAEKQRGGGGEEEADRWARARKRKETSLKFKMEMFSSSKILQSFTGDI